MDFSSPIARAKASAAALLAAWLSGSSLVGFVSGIAIMYVTALIVHGRLTGSEY